jgi:hypothetical protein
MSTIPEIVTWIIDNINSGSGGPYRFNFNLNSYDPVERELLDLGFNVARDARDLGFNEQEVDLIVVNP